MPAALPDAKDTKIYRPFIQQQVFRRGWSIDTQDCWSGAGTTIDMDLGYIN